MTTLTDLMAADAKLAEEAMVGRLDENIPALCARLTAYREAPSSAVNILFNMVGQTKPGERVWFESEAAKALAEIAAKLGP